MGPGYYKEPRAFEPPWRNEPTPRPAWLAPPAGRTKSAELEPARNGFFLKKSNPTGRKDLIITSGGKNGPPSPALVPSNEPPNTTGPHPAESGQALAIGPPRNPGALREQPAPFPRGPFDPGRRPRRGGPGPARPLTVAPSPCLGDPLAAETQCSPRSTKRRPSRKLADTPPSAPGPMYSRPPSEFPAPVFHLLPPAPRRGWEPCPVVRAHPPLGI